MDCKTAQQKIVLYIEHKLPEEELPDFLQHIDQCKACKEDLIVQYSIMTALDQLNHNEEFSDDFVKELEENLRMSKHGIIRKKRKLRALRLLALVLFLVCGFAVGMGNHKQAIQGFLPAGQESSFSLHYYGVPEDEDPVQQSIYQYNDAVIHYLRELQAAESSNQKGGK